MYIYSKTLPTYNIYSNFLTHSYFNVLEKWSFYEQRGCKIHSTSYNELIKSIQSFIFILESSRHSSSYLQAYIFDYLPTIPYTNRSVLFNDLARSYPEALSVFHLPKTKLNLKLLKKCYLHTFNKLSKNARTDLIQDCNIILINLYYFILYIPFKKQKNSPAFFLAPTAEDFITLVYDFKEHCS